MSLDISRIGDWTQLSFFHDTLPAINAALASESRQILPPLHQVFAALELTQPTDTKVVILGQDPYPTPGHAHGLAFSAEPHVHPLPASLRNIYREMTSDLGRAPTAPDLRFWARQGVLLLNTSLTVPEGAANGHRTLGWQHLTTQILALLNDRPRAFVLWGQNARKIAAGLEGHDHLLIKTAHPSPLSASRGFFGSKPFSTVNEWLEGRGETSIDWAGPML